MRKDRECQGGEIYWGVVELVPFLGIACTQCNYTIWYLNNM